MFQHRLCTFCLLRYLPISVFFLIIPATHFYRSWRNMEWPPLWEFARPPMMPPWWWKKEYKFWWVQVYKTFMTTNASNQNQCRFLPFDNALLPSARPVVGKSGSDAAVALWTAAETTLLEQKWIKKRVFWMASSALTPGQMVLWQEQIICIYCRCELSYHRSTQPLRYHLLAEHTADAENNWWSSYLKNAQHTFQKLKLAPSDCLFCCINI